MGECRLGKRFMAAIRIFLPTQLGRHERITGTIDDAGGPAMNHDDKLVRDYRLQIVERTFAVLRTFTAAQPQWSLDDLHQALGINKTSLFRILKTLESEGLVLHNDGTYMLGGRVLELGQAFLGGLPVRDVAAHSVKELAERTKQTVTLGVLQGLSVLYVAIERPQQDVGILGHVGQRYPAHATALGKALLAFRDLDALAVALRDTELERLTHRTIADPTRLLRHLSKVRDDGYALDDEERGIGIRCVAAPIFDHTNAAVASISVSGPIFYLTDDTLPQYTDQLRDSAERISQELGHVRPPAAPSY